MTVCDVELIELPSNWDKGHSPQKLHVAKRAICYLNLIWLGIVNGCLRHIDRSGNE
jgi:hypothetical protein